MGLDVPGLQSQVNTRYSAVYILRATPRRIPRLVETGHESLVSWQDDVKRIRCALCDFPRYSLSDVGYIIMLDRSSMKYHSLTRMYLLFNWCTCNYYNS
jgi:hypothetical protein